MSTTLKSQAAESIETHDTKEDLNYGADSVTTESLDTFPDGGLRAWLVVCGAICSNIATIGFVGTWGVFQSYYEQTLLTNSSPSDIAWIGSIQYALIFMPAVLVGRLFDLGHFRLPFFLGSMGIVATTFLIAECKEYWQFLLVQGILVGIMCAACYGQMVGLIGHWFKQRRGLAICCAALGGPIGGTIFPVVAQQLIPKVGFPWTMRILAFIMLGLMGVSNLTMRRRLPPKDAAGGLFNLKAFKSPAFTTYCLSTLVNYLGLYTLLTFIDSSALHVGVSPNAAFDFVSIANACSLIARIATALFVDRIGPVNMNIPMTIIAALSNFVWPLADTNSSFIVIAVIYGLTHAVWVATFQLPLYDLGDIEDVGRRAGMMMTIASFGSVAGPPISGALLQATGGYAATGYYAGSTMLLSCALALITRQLVLKRLWGRF